MDKRILRMMDRVLTLITLVVLFVLVVGGWLGGLLYLLGVLME